MNDDRVVLTFEQAVQLRDLLQAQHELMACLVLQDLDDPRLGGRSPHKPRMNALREWATLLQDKIDGEDRDVPV